jgi:hypothetical protein
MQQQHQSLSNTMNCGAPHFRSIAKQHRHANYNLEKALNEFIDNVIKLATRIHITTEVDSEGRLQELKISDDYRYGFINILAQGINNPFNMGHIKTGHDDDDETSEFGCGGKAAAISTSNNLYVVSSVGDGFYEVVCDFIKMEKEEDVIASYNPKKREITLQDYADIHPFQTGSSIVLSKILGTICEQTTQQKLTQRIKKGIADTYSRFLRDGMEITVNGETVERDIDFFLDPKCMPFAIKKLFYILEKPGTNDKIYLIQKTVDRTSWQIYNKMEDKWIALKSAKEADDFREAKRREGYYYAFQSKDGIDSSCIRIDSTFTLYSDLMHTDEIFDHLLPFDQVLIYKDNRKYGKKSFVRHSNGIHNYTLHKIEFTSKKIGKELGITFNKEITMDGNNDLIAALKSAVKDSRSGFNADTGTNANKVLCDKALKLGVIDLMTCKKIKLSSFHRDKRILEEEKDTKNDTVLKKLASKAITNVASRVQDDSSDDESVESAPESLNFNISSPSSNEGLLSSPAFDKESLDLSSDASSDASSELDFDAQFTIVPSVTQSALASSAMSSSISLKIDDKNESDEELKESKSILIKVSKMIMDITASDDFDITLENSHRVLDIVQKMLHL